MCNCLYCARTQITPPQPPIDDWTQAPNISVEMARIRNLPSLVEYETGCVLSDYVLECWRDAPSPPALAPVVLTTPFSAQQSPSAAHPTSTIAHNAPMQQSPIAASSAPRVCGECQQRFISAIALRRHFAVGTGAEDKQQLVGWIL
jgi:hypothetical protein